MSSYGTARTGIWKLDCVLGLGNESRLGHHHATWSEEEPVSMIFPLFVRAVQPVRRPYLAEGLRRYEDRTLFDRQREPLFFPLFLLLVTVIDYFVAKSNGS